MKVSLGRSYLGKSAEERITSRRRHLIDTAFDLLSSDGWHQVTIDNLCRQASLNKRYFYESFSDLDELVAAVVDGLAKDILDHGFQAVCQAREAGLSTGELARKAIEAVVTYTTDDPRRARVLFTEISASPRAAAHRRATIHGIADALSAYGREHHNTNSDDVIANLASAVLIGGSIEAILAWLDGNIKMSREQFIDDLAALWVFAGDGAACRARERQTIPDRGPATKNL